MTGKTNLILLSTTVLFNYVFGFKSEFTFDRARAAPAWNPEQLERTTTATRDDFPTQLNHPTLPPTPPLPPIDPNEEFQGGGNLVLPENSPLRLFLTTSTHPPSPAPSDRETNNVDSDDFKIPSVLVLVTEPAGPPSPPSIDITEAPKLVEWSNIATTRTPPPLQVLNNIEDTTTTLAPPPPDTTPVLRKKMSGQFPTRRPRYHQTTPQSEFRVLPPEALFFNGPPTYRRYPTRSDQPYRIPVFRPPPIYRQTVVSYYEPVYRPPLRLYPRRRRKGSSQRTQSQRYKNYNNYNSQQRAVGQRLIQRYYQRNNGAAK